VTTTLPSSALSLNDANAWAKSVRALSTSPSAARAAPRSRNNPPKKREPSARCIARASSKNTLPSAGLPK
jgi:hypothetical protein